MSGRDPPERIKMAVETTITLVCEACELPTEFSLWTDWPADNGDDLYECHDCGHKQPMLRHEPGDDWGYPD